MPRARAFFWQPLRDDCASSACGRNIMQTALESLIQANLSEIFHRGIVAYVLKIRQKQQGPISLFYVLSSEVLHDCAVAYSFNTRLKLREQKIYFLPALLADFLYIEASVAS